MSALHANDLEIRPFQPGDLSTLVRLNNVAAPATNELTAEEMLDLIAEALVCLVAVKDEDPVGLLLCIADGADYESKNYRWLSEKEKDFAYTDRICVDEAQRGQKIGERLYSYLFEHLQGSGRSFVCEVNTRPPNPGSEQFHKRLGFAEIGTADHGEKAVVYMKRQPDPAT